MRNALTIEWGRMEEAIGNQEKNGFVDHAVLCYLVAGSLKSQDGNSGDVRFQRAMEP